MIGRRQPAVVSPISGTAVALAFWESIAKRGALAARANALVGRRFGARHTILTDSGTSALVLALRAHVPRGGIVGFPAFACVDLAAAAQRAGVRVRLYDLDPATLSPDLDSVRNALKRGVDAVVVAHLFGYPADVPAVRRLAEGAGIATIEDAAQAAGGTLHGGRLGTFGDVSVLSFGRGKGLAAGGGGALLEFGDGRESTLGHLELPAPALGWAGLAKTAAQLVLGRPSLYALPSMAPGLHLGEMVFHPAGDPRAMSVSSSSLLSSAFELEQEDLVGRRRTATALDALAIRSPRIAVVRTIPGAVSGYLRYAVRDVGATRSAAPALGVVRSYPQTLSEQPELIPLLVVGEPSTPGAVELRRTLFTLPTHRFVTASDLIRVGGWLQAAS